MGRLVAHKSISRSASIQPVCWVVFTRSVSLTIAGCTDECILMVGNFPCCQITIAPREGLPNVLMGESNPFFLFNLKVEGKNYLAPYIQLGNCALTSIEVIPE